MTPGELWRRFVHLVRRDHFREELEEEIRLHQALRTEANREAGMAPAAAAAASRRAFGNVGVAHEASQDAWGARWLDALQQDLHYGIRTLRKSPGFSIIAVLTLAVGIGATTVMFTVVNCVLLRRLPLREQDRLVVVWAEDLKSRDGHLPLSYGTFAELRERRGAFESLAGVDYNGAWSMAAEVGEVTTTLHGGIVAGDFFGVLGVKPVLGRVLSAADDMVGGPHVLVISYGLWRRVFGGDPHVLGKTLRLKGVAHTIVGVLPQGFEYPRGAEFWTTLALQVPEWESPGTQMALDLVGRLRPGAAPVDALEELNTALPLLVPEARDWRAVLHPLTDMIVGDVRPGILVLSAAALLVLTLASINVGGLLLVRGGARAREFAIRSAVGAGQARVVRQLLTETLVLASIGAVAGVLLAAWVVHVFPAIAPPELPRVDELRIDAAALGFALSASLVAAVVGGLVPARGVARADLNQVLRAGTQPVSVSSWRMIAVVGQIGLALLVLAGAGLLTRSLVLLARVDMGFPTEGLVFVRPWIPPAKYPRTQQVRDLVDQLVRRVQASPGVVTVSPVTHLPFSLTGGIDVSYSADGQDAQAAAANPLLDYVSVGPDYFRTLGLEIQRGRGLSAQDRAGSPLVVVVSEAVARHNWPGQDAIGRRLKFGPPDDPSPSRTVVGVVDDTRYRDLLNVRASVYVPDLQPLDPDQVFFVPTILVIRSPLTLEALLPSVRTAIKEIDPDVPVISAASMNGLLTRELGRPRFTTTLLDVFASLALLLAVTGLYGVMGTHVTQRTREMGIRMALGADAATVALQVVRQGMKLALVGAALGVGAALAGTRLLASLLFGVGPADPLTLSAATLLLLLAALGACYLPARRATRVDPLVSLRYE
jgi:putative ABC transport system permease protein